MQLGRYCISNNGPVSQELEKNSRYSNQRQRQPTVSGAKISEIREIRDLHLWLHLLNVLRSIHRV